MNCIEWWTDRAGRFGFSATIAIELAQNLADYPLDSPNATGMVTLAYENVRDAAHYGRLALGQTDLFMWGGKDYDPSR